MRPFALALLARLVFASPYFKHESSQDDEVPDPESPEFWYRILGSIGLVLAGGVFAGSVHSSSICAQLLTTIVD